MDKPAPFTRTYLDYNRCSDYIGEKLGYDLRDTLGKYKTTTGWEEIEYQDFWHFILDCNPELHNGCEFRLPEIECAEKEWQRVILQAFYDEFGKDTTYWLEW